MTNVEPWEVSYFNGGVLLEEIPVGNRDTHGQFAFRDQTYLAQPVPSLDANRYATKKTIAQGMLDVALLTANASQLKYVLQMGADKHPFYTLMLSLIIISIILQVIVGILFLVIGGMNINDEQNVRTATILNDTISVIIFLITVINVVINSFGLKASDPATEAKIK